MKKYFNFAYVSAIALLGASGFTACSSEDELVEAEQPQVQQVADNPTYDPVGKTVTTQFVLNVSSATSDKTRMSSTTVQKNQNFRGIKDAKLITLATGAGTSVLAPYAGGTTTTDWSATSGIKSKTYDLGTLYSPSAIDNTGEKNKNESSHRVVELTLPLTADAMLVYGRAIPSGTDEANGKVVDNLSTNPAPENITFDLVSRLGTNDTKYQHTCNLSALILNRIMLSEVPATTGPWSHGGVTSEGNLPAISWREIGTSTATLAPLQENLAKLYQVMTGYTTSTTAIRSGSASAVIAMIKDAQKIVNSVDNATATNDAELNAQRLAENILTRIGYYFTLTDGNVSAFKSVGSPTTEGSIAYALVNGNVLTEAQWTTNYGDVTNDFLSDFPTSFKLPAGVSQLFFTPYVDTENGFTYTNPGQSLIDISQTIDPAKYMYPSELLYFDNSLLRVNDAQVAANDYPNGWNVWDLTSSWTGWTVGKVSSTTRSVAVKNNVNYGVAMLQTSVALKTGVTEFLDNRSALVPTESDQKLTAAEVGAFTLTGVLVGGQYKRLGWNYITNSVAEGNVDYIIYDNVIANNGDIPTTTNNENYTLLFDNYNSDGDQKDVLVALEFQNGNERDFYGKGGIITKGSKFYLVGKLDLDEATNSITWPTYYAIPPYTGGATTTTTRIFIQDYMTTATFTIGAESLKNAYNTVPDLRATQTSLGLSVDLNWRSGLNFDVEFQ